MEKHDAIAGKDRAASPADENEATPQKSTAVSAKKKRSTGNQRARVRFRTSPGENGFLSLKGTRLEVRDVED